MSNLLTSEQLYHSCDTDKFNFKTTAELKSLDQVIGQERALKAIDFGIGIDRKGYNLYAMGSGGSGRLL